MKCYNGEIYSPLSCLIRTTSYLDFYYSEGAGYKQGHPLSRPFEIKCFNFGKFLLGIHV